MKIKIQSIHFDADKKLLEFVDSKVAKLTQFHDGIINSEVFLKIDQTSDKENKIAEIKLNIPGNDLFASKQCKTFEEAIDTSVDALKRQVQKRKKR